MYSGYEPQNPKIVVVKKNCIQIFGNGSFHGNTGFAFKYPSGFLSSFWLLTFDNFVQQFYQVLPSNMKQGSKVGQKMTAACVN